MVETEMLRGGGRAMGERAQRVLPTDVVTPATAVADMLQRIDELTPETSGRFVHRNGQLLPW
jgi:hypothetical protein